MQLGDAGLRLIAEFEGFRSHPYLDVVGIPTIGYGNTYYPDTGRRVTLADAPVTEREAADMLLATLARYVDGIDRYAQVMEQLNAELSEFRRLDISPGRNAEF